MGPGVSADGKKRPFWRLLYFWVLIGIVAGIGVGALWPAFGASLQPLGEGFINLVKMIIPPVIFLTVVTGIAGSRQLAALGRVVVKAFVYFLFFSTLALIVGLVVAHIVQPGAGMNVDPATLNAAAVHGFEEKAHDTTVTGFLLSVIPTTLVSAFTSGSILQILFVAVLFGVSLTLVGEAARPVTDMLERIALVIFRLVTIVMWAAPVGAFGAMAFTIGKYGLASLFSLGALVGTFYLTALIFVLGILGAVAALNGFSIFKLIRYLKAELLLVLGTSSSEAALPALIQKMQRAGCDKEVVGVVVPTGYSFNLDGTNIYMTLAALFIAQATGVELSLGEQIALLGVAMLSSKGAAGVTGSGFITLAATLAIVPKVPIAGMALILGVDRFMSECRSLTNFMGNAVATIVVARWEGALDRDQLARALNGATDEVPAAAPIESDPD
ncbi:dicarboxylate/amino acid:cation symporter [Sphingomonas sp. DG1-23]|uniref:dicarboxylate/amino acid:cation symporter n=1 Tax=Sphingomonas sp. DG1-23 TaxID=3068316 RepID=UPI00273E01C2|nr:dicarboxylate/amino acid:cation symporter [Sphingomonas sp. DG1-23]MDP5278278.1 dicarboxylate/amino acid:cation symporter [Sphingomonas sp. DG1-23]